ncbi:AAA family ATPase [uncultured Psychrobacter sp.]|uniref:AAA family ATPase n=1 Tax=uncultured Psychrobacter sp. TaxID=259303 RepID=UPI00345B2C49
MTELERIAHQISGYEKNIILIYAFNGTGKTRLSTAYKDITKEEEKHTGVYYNAFSEDLFVWNNDEENNRENITLIVEPSSLNKFHSLIKEDDIHGKLEAYKVKFDFQFKLYKDTEQGIELISFFMKDDKGKANIKISRGEERIFVWCFFLALLEVEGWADEQSDHIFIDDPVSSLDDHNIFVTAATLYDVIENNYKDKKIIITTHHIGLYSILADWLTKGEKSSRYKAVTEIMMLKGMDDTLTLDSNRKNLFLYHLTLLRELDLAQKSEKLYSYHFALLRQVLENVASFLGCGQISYVLKQIGVSDENRIATILNILSHQKVYHYQSDAMKPDNLNMFNEIFDGLTNKYQFLLHTDKS